MLLLASVIAGCTVSAGRDFARPSDGSLAIGSTTESQVMSQYGLPLSTGTEDKNGVTVNKLIYTYSSNEEALVGGITPVRSLAFFFVDRVLVGYEFVSSYPADHTSFDETKRSMITKGVSTEADVRALLGRPNGEFGPPFVEPPTVRALVYSYQQVQVEIGFFSGEMHHGTKRLFIELDADHWLPEKHPDEVADAILQPLGDA